MLTRHPGWGSSFQNNYLRLDLDRVIEHIMKHIVHVGKQYHSMGTRERRWRINIFSQETNTLFGCSCSMLASSC